MISRRSMELQRGVSTGVGSMISRKSKTAQSSEVVDDITKTKIDAIIGVGRIRQKRKDTEPSTRRGRCEPGLRGFPYSTAGPGALCGVSIA